jgi:hypothetical protein
MKQSTQVIRRIEDEKVNRLLENPNMMSLARALIPEALTELFYSGNQLIMTI